MTNKLLTVVIGSILLLCFVTEHSSAQQWARKMFKEFEHDFGTLAKNEFAEYRFEIENLFEEDITIQSVTTSCTCTDVSLTEKVLKSKEKSYVVAVFNTRSFVGPKQATLTIRFAAPFIGEVQLTVRGNTRSDVMFEPGAIDFGSLTQQSLKDRSSIRQIQITKFNNVNWRIVDVKSTFPHVGVVISSPVRAGNQVKYAMDVRIKDSAPAGFVQGELIVIGENYGNQSSIPIKFSGKVASDLQISPEILTITASEKGAEIKNNIIVKADKPFRISDVTCSNPSFSVTADPDESKKIHFVNVVYSVDQPPGRYEYELEFVTDLNSKTTGKIKAVVEIVAEDVPQGARAEN